MKKESIKKTHRQNTANTTPEVLKRFDKVSELIQQMNKAGRFEHVYKQDNPNHRLYIIAFDGTNNSRFTPQEIRTNPDILENLIRKSDKVQTKYIQGVGTDQELNIIERNIDLLTGDGTEDRAELAYQEFAKQVQHWYQDNPDIQVHLVTIGFSRGTGSQRHFANLIDSRGIKNQNEQFIIQPGEIRFDLMLLFESVVKGQENNLNLAIPKPVQNAVHFVSTHESRLTFPLTSIVDKKNPDDPGIYEIEMPGAHSDIGGGLDPDDDDEYEHGLSSELLKVAHELLYVIGVPIYRTIPDDFKKSQIKFDASNMRNNLLDFMNLNKRSIDYPGNPDRRH